VTTDRASNGGSMPRRRGKRAASPSPSAASSAGPLPYDDAEAASLANLLLSWYDRHRRHLPWRSAPGERPDPYRVWLSEIMLQQTTVATVRDYFLHFTSRWPTVADLAAAPLDDVLAAWAGLGYYARARNLHKCAQAVMRDFGGVFPSNLDALRSLPGIGDYTSGAIAAIAFDQPYAAVDGNVERVMARMFAVEEPLPDSKPRLKQLASGLVPKRRPGDFAQAMMDLGATICAPRKANCLICPWNGHCRGRALGIAETLPRKREKAARPVRRAVAFLAIRRDGAILLRRRPERGLLGGMLEVPSTPWERSDATPAASVTESHAPLPAPWTPLAGTVEHTFTHFHLIVEVHTAHGLDDIPLEDPAARWVPLDDLPTEALPTVMHKIIAHGLKL
jgi:A/G-specific adenine glycosylase